MVTKWCFLWAGLILCPVSVMADCPAGFANEIFCDSFDTYCSGGGFPGSADCAPGATKDNAPLQTVWQPVSRNDATNTTCGTTLMVEDTARYIWSLPFGGRYPCLQNDALGQQAVSDWNSPSPAPGIDFRVASVFGSEYSSVAGTDAAPLTLEFYLSGVNKPEWPIGGGLSRSTGYMELALGTDRANTDHVLSPVCATYCNPTLAVGPFPIICAQGNPAYPMPAGCPSAASAPVHAAMAVGTMPLVDQDPCHCGVQEHGPISWHPAVYDGQKWWELRSNSPVASSGTVTPDPVNPDAPMPPPGGLNAPGNFTLLAGKPGGNGPAGQWVKLTIRTSTFDVEMISREKSQENGYIYQVTSFMAGITRQYLGSFDQLRSGVGAGCKLASSTDWNNCVGGGRNCMVTLKQDANAVMFDDVVLHGGTGYTLAGACCAADGSCTEVEAADCAGRPFHGASTKCADVACCSEVFGDGNNDGVVDMTDFAMLQACATAGGGTASGRCTCFDVDSSRLIDVVDIGRFAMCANGPAAPGNSAAPCRGAGW